MRARIGLYNGCLALLICSSSSQSVSHHTLSQREELRYYVSRYYYEYVERSSRHRFEEDAALNSFLQCAALHISSASRAVIDLSSEWNSKTLGAIQ